MQHTNKMIILLSRSILFLTINFISACDNESPDKKADQTTDSVGVNSDSVKTQLPGDPNNIDYTYVELAGNVTTIRFSEITLSIDRLVYHTGTTQSRQEDSVLLILEPGETIEGKEIKVTSGLSDVKIEQQYETSVTISNEGPHCDLKEWKHFYSGWTSIKQNKDVFTAASYDMNERKKFPDVPMNELKEWVRNQCGEDWYQLVKNINSPNDYPASVTISRYFLKITGSKDGTRTKTRIVVFETPMGG